MTEDLLNEVRFKTTRSSGPGGQHVNKTESRVELYWNVQASSLLGEDEKALVMKRLRNRISGQGDLILAGEKFRSQVKNREEVSERFIELIKRSLKPVKKRKPTRPTKAAKERRIEAKKRRGALKKKRRDTDLFQ
ncbi:MAG: aminoacyl-tRNA hydrolase [Bacteroidales bacterium]|nr:aminoacyl-tRNA hydrolase [Bacteroidales bacterium]MBN2697637.1 aminoacyl-tRNA hydrolase [Bacteroidales bacterium]